MKAVLAVLDAGGLINQVVGSVLLYLLFGV
jgi:hypothetical protein